MKPLFVPLKTEYFRAFERGEKTIEYRAYGARWNERTCTRGRDVTLSHGYSGARLYGRVRGMRKVTAASIGSVIYPPDTMLAAISVEGISGRPLR